MIGAYLAAHDASIAALGFTTVDGSTALAVVLAIVGAAVLVASVVLQRGGRSRRVHAAGRAAEAFQPADGVVEIAELREARGEPNAADPRFERYVGGRSHREDGAGTRVVASGAGPGLLRGRLVLASIFLGRDGVAWSDAEIAEAHRFLFKAGEWLERQAMDWGAPLNVALCRTYLALVDHGARAELALEVANEEYGRALFAPQETAGLLSACSTWARAEGFGDLGEFLGAMTNGVDAEQVVWLVHSRSAGRSERLSRHEPGLQGFRVAVCYAREEDAPAPLEGRIFLDPVTVTHEVLHAFGATDKYGTSLARFSKGDVSHFDVMRLDTERLGKLRIDPLTAREVGWYSGGEQPEAIKSRTRRTPRGANGGFR
jgi:hypothetical protein